MFQDFDSLFVAQSTVGGAKRFHYIDGVALPQDAACYAVPLESWCHTLESGQLFCKMSSIGI